MQSITNKYLKSSVFWDITPCSPLKVTILEEHVTTIFGVKE
jgi:hypothetical protein